MAAPQGRSGRGRPRGAEEGDGRFLQQTHGGWPIAAAIDGDPKTGWSVDPQEGMAHVAVFEAENPVGFNGGTSLSFVLDQGERGHNIGRLKISVTAAKPPIPLPNPSGRRQLIVEGEVPASAKGGMLAVSMKMTRGSQAAMTRNVWNSIEATQAEVGAKVVPPAAGRGHKDIPRLLASMAYPCRALSSTARFQAVSCQ